MNLLIGGVNYPLSFGIEFIRELDKRYVMNFGGLQFGQGVMYAAVYLGQGNPVAIFDMIQAGTATLAQKPSKKDIEKFIEEVEDYSGLCDDFLEKLQNAPLAKKMLERLNKVGQQTEQTQLQEMTE